MENKIKKDEYELLEFFVDHEIKSYKSQLDWYKKYEPNNKDITNITSTYIKRLELLKNKLNFVSCEVEE